jgi:imidazolonepropionase-like amidohydrolase
MRPLAAAAPAGATEIDLSTQTCLPGLIDSYTHLSDQFGPTKYTDEFHWNTADYVVRSTVYARPTLLAGFTTVRNLGDSANEVAACTGQSRRRYQSDEEGQLRDEGRRCLQE